MIDYMCRKVSKGEAESVGLSIFGQAFTGHRESRKSGKSRIHVLSFTGCQIL